MPLAEAPPLFKTEVTDLTVEFEDVGDVKRFAKAVAVWSEIAAKEENSPRVESERKNTYSVSYELALKHLKNDCWE